MAAIGRGDLLGAGRPKYRIYQFLWNALDWVYPPVCGGCERPSERWCSECAQKTIPLTDQHPLCVCCGEIMSSQLAGKLLCPACQAALPLYQAARSYTIFGGAIRKAIHRFKYRQDLGLGEVLSRMLIEKLAQLEWPVDLVAPVPLSPARLRERGYNQSGLLARPIGIYYGIPYAPNALCRTRETRSQVGLNAVERSINLANAFSADSKFVSGRSVLVIDDVMTTGVTLANCTKALMEAGARQVYGLTLARAVIHQDGYENDKRFGIA